MCALPSTMVLRFRDLTARTIEPHRELITKKGHVWWGWWNKPNEKVPRDTFASFSEAITRDKSISIFLLDSGTQTLYRTQLTEIAASPTSAVIPSPDPEATPAYYHDSGFRAWFKLSAEIAEIPSTGIRDYSYAEVLEFSDAAEAANYQDKRVFSLQEMLERRHKTIWFLQPYAKEHRDYQVLPPAPRIPANFVIDPILTSSPYMVQLSDVHFSPKNHAFALSEDEIHVTLARAVIDDLIGLKKHVPPAAVLLTGDFTWLGEAAEFALAKDRMLKLRSAFDLKPEQLLLIPGNHDIQWGIDVGGLRVVDAT